MFYARIIGRDDDGSRVPHRISPEVFAACLSEFARDALTGQQAQEIMRAMGMYLDDSEVAEAQALLATFTGTPQAKLSRYLEVRDVLFLARLQAPGYARPAEVKARLGV
jgi:hypothetical protein